jgi:hypothetical protein
MKINKMVFLKFFSIMFFATLIISLTPTSPFSMVNAADTSKGVPETARHIQTAAQLAAIGGVQSAGEYYVLDNDINLVDEWVPIDDFRGTFDGQNHKITNLYVLQSSNRATAGLFGSTTTVALVKNVIVSINSNGVTASSSFSSCAGGLIGDSGGAVSNCYATGTVSSSSSYQSYAGGLIGFSGGGAVSNCYATGTVSSSSPSYAHAYAGGLIGFSGGGAVSNCYATGTVSSSSCAGGLIGDSSGGAVSNCYATGTVSSSSCAGGLIGSGWKIVENCYATGDVTATSVAGAVYAGGLFGSESGERMTRCYRLSDQTIIGTKVITLGEPLSSKEMQDKNSFVAWDFDTVWAINSKTNQGYPYLRGLSANDSNSSGGPSSTGGSSSSDESSLFGSPLVLAGIATIAIVAVVAVVVFVKKIHK